MTFKLILRIDKKRKSSLKPYSCIILYTEKKLKNKCTAI